MQGKTFTNSTGVGLTGTMPNKGAWTNTPTSKGKVTIPAGYHNGSGYVDTSGVYAKGYTDGKAEAVGSANISYTYHKHVGSPTTTANGCYTVPIYHVHITTCYENNITYGTIEQRLSFAGDDGTYQHEFRCNNCNTLVGVDGSSGGWGIQQAGGSHTCTSQVLICGKSTSTIDSHGIACGKTTSTIESATIIY